MNRKELKALSKNQLEGNWMIAVLFTLCYLVVAIGISVVGNMSDSISAIIVTYVATTIIGAWFVVGSSRFYLKIIENEKANFKDSLIPIKSVLKSLGFSIIMTIFILLVNLIIFVCIGGGVVVSIITSGENGLSAALGLIIAGYIIFIVVSAIIQLFVAMVPFILADKEDLGLFAAMGLSMKMMKGNKRKLFVIWISFIGWFVLSLLTLGIGSLWLFPYVNLTMANFYKDLDKEYTAIQIEKL